MEISQLGSLADLRASGKGGMDPNGMGSTVLATDVLWSDPVKQPGLQTNDVRGVGLVYGPDVTEMFLRENGVSLILRSHEGPDARAAAMEEAMTLELVVEEEEDEEEEDGVGGDEGSQGEHAGHPTSTSGDGTHDGQAGQDVHDNKTAAASQSTDSGDATSAGVVDAQQDGGRDLASMMQVTPELLAEFRAAAVAQCMSLMQDGFTMDHDTPSMR